MTSYKLYYFDIPGRAEPARWLFVLAGVKFEDIRIKLQDWPRRKEELEPPFGQLPFLEITDESGTWRLAHSHSIFRYLAKEFNLLGPCTKEMALGDSYIEQIVDAVALVPVKDKEDKKAMVDAVKGPVTEKLTMLEKYVDESGFFIGNNITLADVIFSVSAMFLGQIYPEVLDPLPKLKALVDKVREKEEFAQYHKKPEQRVFC